MNTKLETQAMLVKLNITGWTARSRDSRVSDDVAERNNADSKSGVYVKNLLAPDAMREIQANGAFARKLHYSLTMPWDDGGYRLLPIRCFERYRSNMDSLIEERIEARENVISRYHVIVEDARVRLGDLFRSEDYPERDVLRDMIAMSYSVMPVPSAGHFVADLASADAERIQADIEASIEGKIRGTVTHLYRRLGKAVVNLSRRMEGEDDKAVIIKRGALENLRSIVEAIPDLNITGDEGLTHMCDDLKRTLSHVSVREIQPASKTFDPQKFEVVKSKADELAQRFAGYFGDGETDVE